MKRSQITILSIICATIAGALTVALAPQKSLAAEGGSEGGADSDAGKVTVKIDKPEIQVQKAPKFNLDAGTTIKKFTQKDWLEVEFKLEFSEPKNHKGYLKFYDDIKVEYYIYLDSPDKEKKRTLTATIDYVNVPIKEDVHSVIYISPSTIYNLTGDKTAKPASIAQWGIEIKRGGEVIGELSSFGAKEKAWWRLPNAPAQEPGRILPKHKTPFAPLWFDYHLEESIQ